MSANQEGNTAIVRISPDAMAAYMTVTAPPAGTSYKEEDLKAILEKNGVAYGIMPDALSAIIQKRAYYMEIFVAKGTPPTDGEDGHFEFLFNEKVDDRPKIMKDGSVDYTSMAKVEIVEAGQEIVHYERAKLGQDGRNVRGEELKARPGRELPRLKGKGFTVSEDETSYLASVDGKVEYKDNRLVVTDMLVIDEDVTKVIGDIHFKGDVLIRGTIGTGMTVQATGDITVDGYVEAAYLEAGGNVILKNGMQGGGKGEINAKKDVSGKFFEQTTIYSQGNVNANALLNCNIICEKHISVSGRFGVLVGGSVSAVEGIDATVIGNMSEIKTHINLGVDQSVLAQLAQLRKQLDDVKNDISKLELAMRQISALIEQSPNADLSQKKMDILRTKISRDSQVSELTDEIQRITDLVDRSATTKLVVSKGIYRGTKITINGLKKDVKNESYNVMFHVVNGEIVSVPNP